MAREPLIADEEGVTIYVWRSEHDGAVVVQIDTHPHTGRVRVYVNDGAVFDADPEG